MVHKILLPIGKFMASPIFDMQSVVGVFQILLLLLLMLVLLHIYHNLKSLLFISALAASLITPELSDASGTKRKAQGIISLFIGFVCFVFFSSDEVSTV